MTATLTALKQSESHLILALTSAADALDAVGTHALDEAIQRLEAAAESARARLAGAMARMTAAVAGLVQAAEGQATDVFEDLSLEVEGDVPSPCTPGPFVTPQEWDRAKPAPEPQATPEPAAAAQPPIPAHNDPYAHLDDHERMTRLADPRLADLSKEQPAAGDDALELGAPVAVAACSPAAVNDEPPLSPAPLFPLPPDDGPYAKAASPDKPRRKRKPR